MEKLYKMQFGFAATMFFVNIFPKPLLKEWVEIRAALLNIPLTLRKNGNLKVAYL